MMIDPYYMADKELRSLQLSSEDITIAENSGGGLSTDKLSTVDMGKEHSSFLVFFSSYVHVQNLTVQYKLCYIDWYLASKFVNLVFNGSVNFSGNRVAWDGGSFLAILGIQLWAVKSILHGSPWFLLW
jgi:hypothetical protein